MMKKTVKKLGAAALALCMMLSMMISASAVTKYYVQIEISDAKYGQSVSYTSPSVSKSGDTLAATVYQLLSANYYDIEAKFTVVCAHEPAHDPANHEPVLMGKDIRKGFEAYLKATDESREDYDVDAWSNWVTENYERPDEDVADLVGLIKDLDTKVSALEDNTDGGKYTMTYTPDLRPGYENDPAYGNTYTFTVTLISKNIASGGSVSTPVTPSTYRVGLAKVDNAAVKLSDTEAAAGDKVTVTVTADEGYKAESVVVETGTGANVTVTDYGSGVYSFTMPEGAVTVAVTVKEDAQIGEEPVQPSEELKFTDVSKDAWYYDAVSYVTAKSYMSGFNANEFGPEKTVTRAMVAQIFYNMESTPAVTSGKDFPDVAYGQWYYNAITWAAANGVVSGYGDGTYQPDKSVTREELAQMFFNYAKAKGLDGQEAADLSKFLDEHEISDWAEEALGWGVGAGLMSGKGGNYIDANGQGVRAEIAQMIKNFCENVKG